MRGDAPRRLRCPKCRTLQGPVPLGPMPYELALEVAVLPVSGWARRKFPDEVNIREQTVQLNLRV